MLRNRFYFCRCVVAINVKLIFRLEVIFFKIIILQRVGSAWFCKETFVYS